MDSVYGFARACAGFLGFTALTGVIWFSSSIDGVEFFAGLILGLSSLVAAVIPSHKLTGPNLSRWLTFLCALGMAGGVVLIGRILVESQQIEWDMIAMDMVNVGALFVMATTARKQQGTD